MTTKPSIHLPAKRNKKYSISRHHIKNWFSENGQLINMVIHTVHEIHCIYHCYNPFTHILQNIKQNLLAYQPCNDVHKLTVWLMKSWSKWKWFLIMNAVYNIIHYCNTKQWGIIIMNLCPLDDADMNELYYQEGFRWC